MNLLEINVFTLVFKYGDNESTSYVADSKSQKKTYSLITAVITQAKGSRLTLDGVVWSKQGIF